MSKTTNDPSQDPYQGYENWKGWTDLFTYSSEEAAYFRGEFRDAKISDSDVFEIGFGSGSFLAWAREQKATVAGTEINPTLVDAARDFNIELLPADFEKIADGHTERFDTIVAFDVFEHFTLDEIRVRLHAIEIMLRPNGLLLLRFPNAQSPFGLAPQNGDPTHKMALSLSVFEQLIQGSRFEVVRYAPSFRTAGDGLALKIVRRLRYVMRDLIGGFLNFIYTQKIPWDPVVVLVLRKNP